MIQLLLGYLPPQVSDWDKVLKEQRYVQTNRRKQSYSSPPSLPPSLLFCDIREAYHHLRNEILCSPHLAEQSDTGEILDHVSLFFKML